MADRRWPMLDEKRSGGLLNQNPDMPGNWGNAADPCPLHLRNYDYLLGDFRAFPEGEHVAGQH